MPDPKEPSEFKVTDRRSVTAEGEIRRDAAADKPQQKPVSEAAQPAKSGPQPQPAASAPAGEAGEVDFPSFLLNLYMTAMMQLGAGPESKNRPMAVDIQGANQMIRVLEILRAKTKGNLDAQEEKLFEQILYELRMVYVEAVRKVTHGK
ncbi:MAG: DUF1844 domain-containing protein [Acidobacteriota bacterium]